MSLDFIFNLDQNKVSIDKAVKRFYEWSKKYYWLKSLFKFLREVDNFLNSVFLANPNLY